MITSIELHNWKTHKDTKLSFSRGTNVLVGMMGAGKSSIMDAISYGLFGTFPGVHHKRVSVDDLITSRPTQQESGSVRISFTLDGRSYTVQRDISMKEGTKATLERDGEYLQSQPQRVTEEISRILKVDYDLFSRAIYSEQNRLDYFLELSSANRKGQIDELLGLDKFATAQENVTSLINRIKDTISEHEKIIASFDSSKLNSELKVLEGEISLLKEKRQALEKEHLKIGEEAKQAESSLKAAKELLAEKTRLSKELAEVKSKIELLASEIGKFEKLRLPAKSEVDREISEINRQLSDIKAKDQQLREKERKEGKEVSEIEANIKLVKQRIAERDKLHGEFRDRNIEIEQGKLNSATQMLHNLEKQLATYQSQREETRKSIGELEKHLSKCPICERELNEEMRAKLTEAKKNALATADSGIKSTEAAIKVQKSETEKITQSIDLLRLANAKLKEYMGLDIQLREAEQKAIAAKGSYEKTKSEAEVLKKSYESSNSKLNELSTNKDKVERLENYRKQILELNAEASKKSAEQKSVNVDDAAVEAMQKGFVEISTRSTKISSEVEAHKRYISDKQKLIDEKNDQVRQINRILGEITQKKSAVDNLAKFKNALEETQRQMRTKLVGSINGVMQNIWPELYPYDDYTGIMLDARSNDYLLMVRTASGKPERWEEVQGIASGGERSIACLAMRVAFALVLVPNLRWIILDEPTHNIDAQGMGRFIKVFNETLPKIIDQIFIIT
ncbi:MAG: AAA family ATPase, partial [Candidatus Micrarchaeota archaeon]|nr:AAA family ATPase [Candidatus Micrarchaeota archaeon]